ncbi:hypothetical protein CDL12_18864 [Handroanthus impetiginosus]|uniref:Uncharacterized protein n=1 Tax=Handroanthus impetiginosus TaxID=429701 RepID=A0A2G9GTD8_9LAMI|nr:hypothetical protein CDL12_18864 [Handroanthus impetiginosus]
MKRLRSSDDLHSYGEKGVVKDWGRRDEDSGLQRSSSSLHRSSYYKSSDSGRKVISSSSSRYDRLEDDRESSRVVRKRSDYDLEGYDRRKGYDRHRDVNERGILSSSPRAGYGMDQMYRSESFSGPRRDFPKGFRSERDRPKRDGVATSWRRFGAGKDGDDGARSSSEVGRGSRMESKEVGKAKSPQRLSSRSPAWSKDSGSERSKSVEGKKCDDMPVESSGPSSEREEGELEPDPQPHVPVTEPAVKDKVPLESNSSQKELNNEVCGENKASQDKANFLSVEKEEVSAVGSSEEQADGGPSKVVEDVPDQNDEFLDRQDTSPQGAGGSRDENDTNGETEGRNNVMESRREGCLEEDTNSTRDEKLSSLQEQREGRGVDSEKKADHVSMTGNVEITSGSGLPSMEKMTSKDKGKGIALFPSDGVHFTETNLEVENKPRDLAISGDIEMEGPSTRGFQFFSTDPIKKPENVEHQNKPKDDKLALELSLSLPNVLLPIGSQNRGQGPGSPSHARSVQSFASSFRTNSDGFTASMSFSGSQQFTHNPSCSLTHNALDFEQSVGSKPLFQGVDWKALSSDENKNKEVPTCQGMPSRENGLHQQSQSSQGNSSGQPGLQHLRVAGGSSKLPIGLERQLSLSKHLSGAHGFGPYENGTEYSKDRRQLMTEKDISSLPRGNIPDGKEQVLAVGADFAESIVTMIVSEPLHTMARRFNDMTAKHMACLKEFVHDIISNPGKQWQLSALQKAMQKRGDITLDMLLTAHRTQLEILVAIKTGLREFLLQKYDIPPSYLAEVFLNMRCKNLNCKCLLPVDECDCKICSQQSDFCRENGRSETGAEGTTEMQFYCVACDHPSEMFGFVKEVFQNFLKEWTEENLSRELEYVRRIFSASEDVRGKQLHEIAARMLSKLANRADLQEVQHQIMNFFSEVNSDRPANISIESRKELPTKNQEGSNGVAGGSSQGAGWMKPVYPDKSPILENPINLLPGLDGNRNDKYTLNMDIRKTAQKEPIFDELESIVRIKQAEAKMFQSRADDARRESEALKRISVTKNERIDEEYKSRINKLRLAEAEEMRKQKVEELQALERAYQEYFTMKVRMETDIKDLLLKMEATRRNLTT